MASVRDTLLKIFENHSYDLLECFKDTVIWKSFSHDEKVLFSRLLVLQGAQQLSQGNQQVFESFSIASKVSCNDPEIFYQQGFILSSYRENLRCLKLAHEVLNRAIELNIIMTKAWVLQTQVLTDIGVIEEEASYFIEADRAFTEACALWDHSQVALSQPEFFWKWGVCLTFLGKLSGEPHDFHQSISKYRQAKELGCQEFRFFIDYGQSLVNLGTLLEKPEYFAEALLFFNQAVQRNSEHFEGWFNQGCCFQILGEIKNHFKLLEQAERSFIQAVEINPESSLVWLKWGQLEATIGKMKRDQDKILSGLQKFERAHQLDENHPEILSNWAENELFLGVQEDNLEMLQSSRVKILICLEIQPDNPDTWYLYGSCLTEMGRYFQDENLFRQAIEKFQYGLSLTSHHSLLWYGMGLVHYALGELTEQQVLFEKANRYFARVIENGKEASPQFWNDWGVSLLKTGEISQETSFIEMAIEKFERALKQPLQNLDEEDVDLEWVYHYSCAFDLLGELTEEPHYFEKAIQILTQILQVDPHYHLARYNLALAHTHLGEAAQEIEHYHKAIELFQIVLDQNPEDEMIHLDFGICLTNLGLLIHDIHHPEQSEAIYRQAENHFLNSIALGNTQGYYQIAGLYSLLGEYNLTMVYLERAFFCGILPKIDDLLHDEWLEGIKGTPEFKQFINELSSQHPIDEK